MVSSARLCFAADIFEVLNLCVYSLLYRLLSKYPNFLEQQDIPNYLTKEKPFKWRSAININKMKETCRRMHHLSSSHIHKCKNKTKRNPASDIAYHTKEIVLNTRRKHWTRDQTKQMEEVPITPSKSRRIPPFHRSGTRPRHRPPPALSRHLRHQIAQHHVDLPHFLCTELT